MMIQNRIILNPNEERNIDAFTRKDWELKKSNKRSFISIVVTIEYSNIERF